MTNSKFQITLNALGYNIRSLLNVTIQYHFETKHIDSDIALLGGDFVTAVIDSFEVSDADKVTLDADCAAQGITKGLWERHIKELIIANLNYKDHAHVVHEIGA